MITFWDGVIIGSYFVALLALTFFKKKNTSSDDINYLLAGRTLSLPAFVATLVSTWYGGILGVGEFGYQYGLSQWIVFGVPYYLFALLFAFFLSDKIRNTSFLSLPEAITHHYGTSSGKLSGVFIFLLTSPAPYIVMLAFLFRFIFNDDGSFYWYAIGVTLFSSAYVWHGGFSSVVRTDILQFILMYVGFALLVYFGLDKIGGIQDLWAGIPESHKEVTGGQPISYVLVWFFIALWTFVDPGFHQRVAAAESPKTAKLGITLSVVCWVLFDLLTLCSSLIGYSLIQESANPTMIYPELGALLLPVGIRGLFILGILATIMSTLDSFLFISGQTIGNDVFKFSSTAQKSTRFGIVLSASIGIGLSIIYPSVISLWYGLGTALIPGLLLTVLGSYIPFFKIKVRFNLWMMILGSGVSLIWLVLASDGVPFLHIEPFYPGLFSALIVWAIGKATVQ